MQEWGAGAHVCGCVGGCIAHVRVGCISGTGWVERSIAARRLLWRVLGNSAWVRGQQDVFGKDGGETWWWVQQGVLGLMPSSA